MLDIDKVPIDADFTSAFERNKAEEDEKLGNLFLELMKRPKAKPARVFAYMSEHLGISTQTIRIRLIRSGYYKPRIRNMKKHGDD